MIESGAWVDKFQPKTIEECFLPSDTKKHLEVILKTGEVPSMFFSGPPGIGKTTTALAICNELDLENMVINASLFGNIDTVRTDVQAFASTVAFNGKKKIIILDEADGLTAAAQGSLRAVINEYVDNAAFILTANFRNKIIEPLISRFVEVDFLFSKSELPKLAVSLYAFIKARLDEEGVQYDAKAVQHFVKERVSKSTDIRKTLILAQKIAKTGVFDHNSLIDVDDGRLQDLIGIIKSSNFDKIRAWVGENSDLDFATISRFLYDNHKALITVNLSIPVLIGIINEHQYRHAFVVDKEINLASMVAEISVSM